MNVRTFECNQNKAIQVYVDGHYKVMFPTPVTLDDGDQWVMWKCTVDSLKSDANTIIVPQDIVASTLFSMYETDYSDPTLKENGEGDPWTTSYGKFAIYEDIILEQLNSCRVTMPSYINAIYNAYCWFSWIDINGVFQHHDINNRNGGYEGVALYAPPLGYNDHFIDCTDTNPIVYRVGTLKLIQILIASGPDSTWNDPQWYDPVGNVITPVPLPPGVPAQDLLLQHNTFVIPQGRYAPEEVAKIITQNISSAGGVLPVTAGNQVFTPTNPCLINIMQRGDLLFVPITDNVDEEPLSNCYKYKETVPGTGVYPYIFMGASLMAIDFGLTGDVFQISYANTPFYDPDDPDTINVALYTTGSSATNTLRYLLLDTASGITYHDLQPHAFWESLGLYDSTATDVNQPVTTPLRISDTGQAYFQASEWKYCKQGTSVNMFPVKYQRDPPIPVTFPRYYRADAIPTVALVGEAINSNATGGYYKIIANVSGVSSDYYSNEIQNNVAGVVSTQYNTANTITGTIEDGIPYVHRGNSAVISGMEIDIRDAMTDATASVLGPNNSVWFQLIKAPPAPAPAPRRVKSAK